jgi:hypothetical protein
MHRRRSSTRGPYAGYGPPGCRLPVVRREGFGGLTPSIDTVVQLWILPLGSANCSKRWLRSPRADGGGEIH